MPEDVTTKFADFLLRHQHYLHRVENGTIQAMEAPYKKAKAEIYNKLIKLQEAPLQPGGIPAVREWRLARLNAQLAEIDNVLGMARADSVGALQAVLPEVANVENMAYTKMLAEQFDKIGIDIVGLPYDQINFILEHPLIYQYRGLSIPEGSFFNDQKFVSAIRRDLTQSIIQGEDMARAVRRLGVNPEVAGLTGLMGKELKGYLTMVARSEIQHVSNEVNRGIYAANQDILKGVIYAGTLDNRTCVVCGADDGREFKFTEKGGDHNGPQLPRHPHCRCCYIPLTKTWKELGSKIPEHIDEKSKLPFMGNPFPKQTYEQWLIKQPDDFQLDVLGPARYKLWKKGEFPLKEMVRNNRVLTIEELEKLVRKRLASVQGDIIAKPSELGTIAFWKKALGYNLPEENADYFYHATFINKLDGIKTGGLKPQTEINFPGFSNQKYVSLAPTVKDVEYWSIQAFWRLYDDAGGVYKSASNKPVLLRVKKGALGEVKQVRPDEFVASLVKKGDIEIWNGKWEKLVKPEKIVLTSLEKEIGIVIKNGIKTLDGKLSSPAIRALAKQNGIDWETTRKIIDRWTEQDSFVNEVTALQRAGLPLTTEMKPLEKIFDWLPSYDGRIYRSVSKKTMLDLKNGDEYIPRSLSSWTHNDEYILKRAGAERNILTVANKTGIDISDISAFPNEGEVLTSSRVRYVIKNKTLRSELPEGHPMRLSKGMGLTSKEMTNSYFIELEELPLFKLGKIPIPEKPMSSIGKFANCIISSIVEMMIVEKVTPSPCNDYVRGSGGKWFLQDQVVVEKQVLDRLNNLKLPPSWKDVVVATSPKVKVQAIGLDKAGRWQYRYSAEHIEKAAQEKFNRLKLFSKDMPKIRKEIEKGILNNDPRAYLLKMEDRTAIRVGSTKDFKAKKKAYGLTTLKNEHVTINGDKIILDFVAKEGLPAHYEIEDRILAQWLSARKTSFKIGDDLFPDVSATKLNSYLKEISGGDYSIKDFRTFHGTRIAYEELRQHAGKALTAKEKKEIIKQVSEKASNFLHNTPTMARNSYIDPMVWDFIGGL